MGETGVEHYWEMGEGMEEEKEGGQHPYETVKRPSVCLSHRSTAAAACGGFAAERRAGRRSRSTAGAALSNKCGQCHVDSRGMRLNTDYRSAEVSAYANSALHLYSRRY